MSDRTPRILPSGGRTDEERPSKISFIVETSNAISGHENGISDELAIPPAERAQHDPVERLPQAIADDEGRPADPYRVVTLLMRMERNGEIDADMLRAAIEFHVLFRRAHHDTLKTADMARIPTHGVRPASGAPDGARWRVYQIIQMLGGQTSLMGSCAWNVLGEEQSLSRWARERTRLKRKEARGILRVTLETLVANEQGPKRRR